jgi:hypothetical protein
MQFEYGGGSAAATTATEQLFSKHNIRIYDLADEENWTYFWQHKRAMVGIDTEGNQSTSPVLLQIATLDYAILEVPTATAAVVVVVVTTIPRVLVLVLVAALMAEVQVAARLYRNMCRGFSATIPLSRSFVTTSPITTKRVLVW